MYHNNVPPSGGVNNANGLLMHKCIIAAPRGYTGETLCQEYDQDYRRFTAKPSKNSQSAPARNGRGGLAIEAERV